MRHDSRNALGRDLAFAYAAAAARVLAWVVVSGLVFRKLGAADLGLLALARATVGLVGYAGVGLAPAVVHRIARNTAAEVGGARLDDPNLAPRAGAPSGTRRAAPADPAAPPILAYHAPGTASPAFPTHAPYANGLVIGLGSSLVALVVTYVYAAGFDKIHHLSRAAFVSTVEDVRLMVLFLGAGTVLRMFSDVPAAVLQTTGRIWLDSAVLAAGEIGWAAFVVGVALFGTPGTLSLATAGMGFGLSGWLVLALRLVLAGWAQRLLLPPWHLVRAPEMVSLLGYGAVVVLGQLADWLYAPVDMVLINQFLGPATVAVYAPAVQIDGGLLLLVSGLAGVLLPRAALAHARRDAARVWSYYVRGTVAGAAALLAAAAIVWVLSPWIFRLWLGDDMPDTRRVLPLVLLSTVVGGSSIVGRSVLLGIGKAGPFTASVLVAGAANVVLSFIFVKYAGLGLPGIVLGTLIVVVARCALWMPWYVRRCLRDG